MDNNEINRNYSEPYTVSNSKPKKKSNKVLKGLLVIFTPIIGLVIIMILQTITRFVFSKAETQENLACSSSQVSDAYYNENCLVPAKNTAKTLLNLISIVVGLASVLSILPCLIIGIIILSKNDPA